MNVGEEDGRSVFSRPRRPAVTQYTKHTYEDLKNSDRVSSSIQIHNVSVFVGGLDGSFLACVGVLM